MLHRFAKFVAGCTVLLVLAGSLVTSTGSGLSVPDWPTSYGWNMFTFPPSKWVGGIFYEHGHRLIASTVGCLTMVLAAWLWLQEPRRWLKWLGVGALGAVVAQGVLGGLTVLFFLPAAISTAHAGLAEIFFCLVVSIALFTSPGWIRGYRRGAADDREFRVSHGGVPSPGTRRQGFPSGPERRLRLLATSTTVLIYAQILLGATMRHTGAGLAIPDFPLMLGHIVPPHWDSKIAIHFSHRVGALVVILAALSTAGHAWLRVRDRFEFRGPAALLVALVAVQATLGAFTVLSGLNMWFNSIHVVCGALVLTTSLVLTLRTWRDEFADAVFTIAEPRTTVDAHRVRAPEPPDARGTRVPVPLRRMDAGLAEAGQPDGGGPA
jgi:cytochrome c oxidase assembly protein subunit 15